MTHRMKHPAALTLILLCVIALVPGALAQADKPLKTKGGFVTTSDRIKIHYVEAGTRRSSERLATPPSSARSFVLVPDPAILLVPGFTMPAWIWEKQITYFAKTHRVVVMDPRSQGESTQTAEGLYPAARARDIKAVVDQLKLAPVVLVGSSMGVIELVSYVDQFGTDGVAGLVFVDGTPGSDYSVNEYKGWLGYFASFQKDRRKYTEELAQYLFKQPQSEDYLKRITEAALRTPTNSALALQVGTMAADNRPALAKIDKPTLIVIPPGSLFQAANEDMQKRIAGSRLEVIENAGHLLFVDQPDRFNCLFADFLTSLAPPSSTQ